MLKIIGAGFGRTGTMSLQAALNQLGFPCYHMMEVVENRQNRSHLEFWRQVARGKPGDAFDWEHVYARYTAAVDNPTCCVWRELMTAYPDARVILTLHPRGPDTWWESTMATIYQPERMWQFKFLGKVTPFGRRWGEMVTKLIWQRSHRGTMEDRGRAVALYHQHAEEVKATVPPERLLVYSVDQGWAPLCTFLGVPVPSTAFPSVNDRAAFRKMMMRMASVSYAIIGVIALLVVGVIGWLISTSS